MNEKILFVDDEPNILDGVRRQLRKRFEVDTALGGDAALEMVRESGPYAVVVSDMKMPGMNGAELLARVRNDHPDSVRMILSGQAELDQTISAVNDGGIFRFLTKPCDSGTLIQGLEVALDQYRLVVAERQLLEETLSGAVKVLTEVLGLINPEAFSRASRIREYAECIVKELGLPVDWQVPLAAMLSQIGCISLPGDLLARAFSGEELSEDEREMFTSHPKMAAKLIASIPRLETVSAMIEGELLTPDLTSLPDDLKAWDPAVLGSQILRASIEYDRQLALGEQPPAVLAELRKSSGLPKQIVDALKSTKRIKGQKVARTLSVADLQTTMVVDEDVRTKNGALLVPRGEEVTYAMLVRLRNFARGQGVVEPFRVLVAM